MMGNAASPHCLLTIKPGIYRLINRESGTAMSLHKEDYSSVICSPPCEDDLFQMWEIAPSGAGYTFRNVIIGTYLSVKELSRKAPVFAGHFPVSWQVSKVKATDENAEMMEIRWPHAPYTFDLANFGSSTPGTKVEIMDVRTGPVEHRCRLWKLVFLEDLNHSEFAQEGDDGTSSITTINTDVPAGGEVTLITTNITRTVVRK